MTVSHTRRGDAVTSNGIEPNTAAEAISARNAWSRGDCGRRLATAPGGRHPPFAPQASAPGGTNLEKTSASSATSRSLSLSKNKRWTEAKCVA